MESKIPDTLGLGFLNVRPEERDGALLCLLKYVVKPDSMTIIFAPTKHHVDFIHLVSFSKKNFNLHFVYIIYWILQNLCGIFL